MAFGATPLPPKSHLTGTAHKSLDRAGAKDWFVTIDLSRNSKNQALYQMITKLAKEDPSKILSGMLAQVGPTGTHSSALFNALEPKAVVMVSKDFILNLTKSMIPGKHSSDAASLTAEQLSKSFSIYFEGKSEAALLHGLASTWGQRAKRNHTDVVVRPGLSFVRNGRYLSLSTNFGTSSQKKATAHNEASTWQAAISHLTVPTGHIFQIDNGADSKGYLQLNDSGMELSLKSPMMKIPDLNSMLNALSPTAYRNLPGGALFALSLGLNPSGIPAKWKGVIPSAFLQAVTNMGGDMTLAAYPSPGTDTKGFDLVLEMGATAHGNPANTLMTMLELLGKGTNFVTPLHVPGALYSAKLGTEFQSQFDSLLTARAEKSPELAELFKGKTIAVATVGRSFVLATSEPMLARAVSALSNHKDTLADDPDFAAEVANPSKGRLAIDLMRTIQTASGFVGKGADGISGMIGMVANQWPEPISLSMGTDWVTFKLPMNLQLLKSVLPFLGGA